MVDAVDALKGSISAAMSGNFIVGILLSASLQSLWGMLRAMQIITFVSMVDVMMPVHFNLFFTGAVLIASVDVLEMESMYEEHLTFAETSAVN